MFEFEKTRGSLEMSNKKVKKFSFILLGNLFFLNQVYAGSKFCFDQPIDIYCEGELEKNFSLNGKFKANGQFYEFSARRAFDGEWCQNTIDKLLKFMRSEKYCIKFDESSDNFDLTIDEVVSKSNRWTYFEDKIPAFPSRFSRKVGK